MSYFLCTQLFKDSFFYHFQRNLRNTTEMSTFLFALYRQIRKLNTECNRFVPSNKIHGKSHHSERIDIITQRSHRKSFRILREDHRNAHCRSAVWKFRNTWYVNTRTTLQHFRKILSKTKYTYFNILRYIIEWLYQHISITGLDVICNTVVGAMQYRELINILNETPSKMT